MPNTPIFILTPAISEDKITEKWDNTGLLEGLSPEQKIVCAKYFEFAVQHVLSTDSSDQDVRLQLTLPAIRRLVAERDDVEIAPLLEGIDEFIANHYFERVKTLTGRVADPEEEALAEFCTNYKPPMFTRLKQLSL